ARPRIDHRRLSDTSLIQKQFIAPPANFVSFKSVNTLSQPRIRIMPSMTFRFETECELTMRGDSYEDIYLQFKEFMHGDRRVALQHAISVYPPESVQVFFHTDSSNTLHEI